jgi:hypothetical protein
VQRHAHHPACQTSRRASGYGYGARLGWPFALKVRREMQRLQPWRSNFWRGGPVWRGYKRWARYEQASRTF